MTMTQLIQQAQSDDGAQWEAIKALGEGRSADAASVLIQVLQENEDWAVRRLTTWALGQIGGDQAVLALIQALEDEDADVRQGAVFALSKVGGRRAADALLEVFDRGEDGDVLDSVIEALGRIGEDRAVALLISTLDDENEETRELASEALGRIAALEAVPALGKMALNDPVWYVRCAAVAALGEMGNAQALSVLTEAFTGDSDKHVRHMAARMLRRPHYV